MTLNLLLLGFATAFLVCALSIPLIIQLAARVGAIDTPGDWRRIHNRSIPRMGGVGLALGVWSAILLVLTRGEFREWDGFGDWQLQIAPILAALTVMLMVGLLDDKFNLSPRWKLGGQCLAIFILYLGGIRIAGLDILGTHINLSAPIGCRLPWFSTRLSLDLPSLVVTLLWFTACTNIWNLIDGMDGLASGVGSIVAGTLMLVAVYSGNLGTAVLAAALMGGLGGFLLYNWNPACIFLGDSGSLQLGLLIGVLGIQASAGGASEIPILYPMVAMGLPVCDTAMAIFRRWVRDLPLSSADRRHIHHLLLALGLTTKQSVKILYLFTTGLCGVVMLGVAFRSDLLVLVLGLTGSVAFLLILTSRKDELTQLLSDLRARRARRRMERQATRLTWDLVHRIELCNSPESVCKLLEEAAEEFGAKMFLQFEPLSEPMAQFEKDAIAELGDSHYARFVVKEPSGVLVRMVVGHSEEIDIDADILFRSTYKLAEVAAKRLSFLSGYSPPVPAPEELPAESLTPSSESNHGPALALAGSPPIQTLVPPPFPAG